MPLRVLTARGWTLPRATRPGPPKLARAPWSRAAFVVFMVDPALTPRLDPTELLAVVG